MSKRELQANTGESAEMFTSEYDSFLLLVKPDDRSKMAALVAGLDLNDPATGGKLALMMVSFGLLGQIPPAMLKALKPYLDIVSAQALGNSQTVVKVGGVAGGHQALALAVAAAKDKRGVVPGFHVEEVEVVTVITPDDAKAEG